MPAAAVPVLNKALKGNEAAVRDLLTQLNGFVGGLDKQKDAIMGAIPMRRMGASAEVASAVAYLASSEAGYVTGQTSHVNGGMAMI